MIKFLIHRFSMTTLITLVLKNKKTQSFYSEWRCTSDKYRFIQYYGMNFENTPSFHMFSDDMRQDTVESYWPSICRSQRPSQRMFGETRKSLLPKRNQLI